MSALSVFTFLVSPFFITTKSRWSGFLSEFLKYRSTRTDEAKPNGSVSKMAGSPPSTFVICAWFRYTMPSGIAALSLFLHAEITTSETSISIFRIFFIFYPISTLGHPKDLLCVQIGFQRRGILIQVQLVLNIRERIRELTIGYNRNR